MSIFRRFFSRGLCLVRFCICLLMVLFATLIFLFVSGIRASVDHNLIEVALVCQLPELEYGCELTSLTMLLQHKGLLVDKLDVANLAPHDNTELLAREDLREIYVWGNPVVGYVGDITGNKLGYTIDPKPVVEFLDQTYDVEALDLTGVQTDELKDYLYSNHPIMVWVTYDFKTDSRPRFWLDTENNLIRADFNMHCVILTGYDNYNFYYNDPLRNKKNAVVNQDVFTCGWVIHGRKALCLV